MENANANIVNTANTIAARMTEGATLLGEYITEIDNAIASTEGKGLECTKYTYTVGFDMLNNVEAFKTHLDKVRVKLRDGYSIDNHFYAVIKGFVASCQMPTTNGGAISRIASICQDAYENNIEVGDIEAYIEQLGGMRAAYNFGAAKRKNGLPANDNGAVDYSLHLQVHGGSGFMGILNLTAKDIAKLIITKGYKTTDGDDDPTSGGGGGGLKTEIIVGGGSTTFTTAVSVAGNDNGLEKDGEFTFASFFACAGGADYGMVAAGGKLVYANEFRAPVARLHELNHGSTVDTRSISDTEPTDYNNPTLMVGGFPCQPFSTAGNQMGQFDPRGEFGPVFARKIMAAEPAAFICENVPPFLSDEKFSSVFNEMMRTWGSRYKIGAFIFNAADYGVPQTRKRSFIIGYHSDLGIAFNPADMTKVEKRSTLLDAIGDLTQDAVLYNGNNRARLTGNEYSGSGYGKFIADRSNNVRSWDQPSFTIVSHIGGIPLHPEPVDESLKTSPGVILNASAGTYHRRLTIRECARIQTFPDTFNFGAGLILAHDVIGNAIPPMMMEAIAKVVAKDLTKVGVISPTNDNSNFINQEVVNG